MMFTGMNTRQVSQNDYSLRQVSAVNPNDCSLLDIKNEINPSDEKNYISLIKQITRFIRSSYEYREYIKFLKESQGQGRCAFLGVVEYESESAGLDIHHCPFTIFDVIDIVMREMASRHGTLRVFEIAEQVMVEHQNNRIGLVPLSKTCHQLVHDGQLFIPLSFVFGDYEAFIADYKSFISPAQNAIVNKMREESKLHKHDPSQIPEVLQTQIRYHG